jgi:hypothetical protein
MIFGAATNFLPAYGRELYPRGCGHYQVYDGGSWMYVDCSPKGDGGSKYKHPLVFVKMCDATYYGTICIGDFCFEAKNVNDYLNLCPSYDLQCQFFFKRD